MKWVVEGVAYNTATSTLLANREWSETTHEDERGRIGPYFESKLYQTQKGAYFVHKSTSWWDPEDSPHGPLQPERDECIPLTAEQASAWLLKGNVKIIHNPFALGEVPEAAAEAEPGATIHLRVPATLKHRVDTAASDAGMSSNAWVMRCIEGCLAKSND